MGSAQSYVSSELVGTALTGLVIAGAVGIGFTRRNSPSGHVEDKVGGTSAEAAIKKGKKKKQNKGPAGGATSGVTSSELPVAAPQLACLSDLMPGQFDVNSRHVAQDSSAAENVIQKSKKSKRKKNKTTDDAAKTLTIPTEYHSESSEQMIPKSRNIKRSSQPQTPEVTPVPETSSSRTLRAAAISLDTDDSWTQVGSRRSRKSSALLPSAESQSEASFTTSQKGERSPVRNAGEDDPHDSFLLGLPSSSWDVESRKALAEKLLPQPQKTGEEGLPDSPQANRVAPLPNEKPAAGFSWADYEDVRVTTDGGENDADGEDDGWGVVTSKRPRRPNMSSTASQPLRASETLTKKQRQNAQKREQQKAAKVEAEAQRLAALAGHKRGLEKVRMEELFSKASSSKPSGGMKASVDERGKLIWE